MNIFCMFLAIVKPIIFPINGKLGHGCLIETSENAKEAKRVAGKKFRVARKHALATKARFAAFEAKRKL